AFDESGKCGLAICPGESWQDIQRKFPEGWQPDYILLYLQYRIIPEGLWQANLPIIGMAGDWNLQWHHYGRQLPLCDLVLTDSLGAELFAREGMTHIKPANIFGGPPGGLPAVRADIRRDIDVLFIGNVQAAVQRERLPWLARLAKFRNRW